MVREQRTIAENDMAVLQRGGFGNETLLLKYAPDPRAMLFVDLITRWGIFSIDTAPGAGERRSSVSLVPVEQVVQRAVDMTELAWDEMTKRGWLLKVDRTPPPEDDDGVARITD